MLVHTEEIMKTYRLLLFVMTMFGAVVNSTFADDVDELKVTTSRHDVDDLPFKSNDYASRFAAIEADFEPDYQIGNTDLVRFIPGVY